MSTDSTFAPRTLTASEYVRELFGPEDNAAILVRSRSTGHTVQTIAKAETIASPDYQSWLAGQSASGYDVFMGMNPIKDGPFSRTKGNIKDIRHVYLDLDRKGDEALQAIRNSSEVPAPNDEFLGRDISCLGEASAWRMGHRSNRWNASCLTWALRWRSHSEECRDGLKELLLLFGGEIAQIRDDLCKNGYHV
jgi:hypothetical protein